VILLAHLSDTHFDGHERSQARAQQVMDYLNGLPGRIDAIVHTGDITDHGLPVEQEQAAKTLKSPVPVHTCPGNHDGYTPYDWPRNQAVEVGHVTLLLADLYIDVAIMGPTAAPSPSRRWTGSPPNSRRRKAAGRC
jgi:3',5'-cyclic-AMP phosphodiesterase